MKCLRLALLALALAIPRSVEAQGAPVEWGVDGGITVSLDPTVTIVSIPVSQVRAGFSLQP